MRKLNLTTLKQVHEWVQMRTDRLYELAEIFAVEPRDIIGMLRGNAMQDLPIGVLIQAVEVITQCESKQGFNEVAA